MNGDRPVIPVSLILTTRNEAAHIALFLDGVRAQTVAPAEIVVCDGGSTDGTAALLREHGADLPLRLIDAPGANIARGRNLAIRAATQDVLAITDAGCEIDPHWLERITAPLLATPEVDAVGGGYALAGETRLQRWTRAATLHLEQQRPEDFLPSSRSFAVRRAAIEAAGMYPEHLTFAGEDTALVLAMKARGARFVTRWDALVRWYPRDTLAGFLRQHWLYGLGDGEARSSGARYARTLLKWGGIAALALFGLLSPWLLLLVPAAVWLNARRLCPVYRWRSLPIADRLGAYAVLVLKEWSMFAGYLAGRLRGAPGRRDG
ncbi:MAG: glycosyltransferase [Bacteroidetes bacterium]|nr:glycosyltransferase [Bacteroidota bacterium]